MPRRIQRKRTAGWRMPEGAVYVGRPSKWGNPYNWADYPDTRITTVDDKVTTVTFSRRQRREWAFADYRDQYLAEVAKGIGPEDWPTVEDIRAELAGRDLACWCPLDQPCHADTLLHIANGGSL